MGCLVFLLATTAASAQTPAPADVVLLNAKAWTAEAAQPAAEAVAIRGNRIVKVGSNAEVRALIREGQTRVLDLKGALVLPSFIDNHTHFAQAGRLLLGLNLLDVSDAEAMRVRVAEAAKRLPPGAWLVGGDWGAYAQWSKDSTGRFFLPQSVREAGKKYLSPGKHKVVLEFSCDSKGAPINGYVLSSSRSREFDNELMQAVRRGEFKSLRCSQGSSKLELKLTFDNTEADSTTSSREFLPTKDLIDPVTGDHPALINRFDGQLYLANSLALKAAGITAATPNPEGGEILRGADGEPNGLLRGSAVQLVRKAMPPPSYEQRKAEALRALEEARRWGVTTIHDNTSFEALELFRDLQRSGELTSRVWARMPLSGWEKVRDYIREKNLPAITGGWGDDFIRLGGLKAWVDGIMGNSSALFWEPYSNSPAAYGRLRPVMSPEGNLHRLVSGADRAGFTVTVHAIGDYANHLLLDTYERVFAKNPPRDRRFRVVHAQVLDAADIPRFGKLQLVAEVQPYHAIDDMRWMEERIGDRSRGAYAFATLAKSGAKMSFGSDWPGTNASYYPINPLLGIYAAVTRQTLAGQPAAGWFPGERVAIEDAVRNFTINNAWATFEENSKGSIKEGKLADLVVLDRDIFSRPPSELRETQVLFTILDGKIVYQK